MWQVTGTRISNRWLDLSSPAAVLYEFDGPRIFTCKDTSGQMFLAYLCGEEDQLMRFLVVPFSDDLERRLKEGEISLHDALWNSQEWVFDVDYNWQTTAVWKIDVESLPPKTIPMPGVMLYPALKQRYQPIPANGSAKATEPSLNSPKP